MFSHRLLLAAVGIFWGVQMCAASGWPTAGSDGRDEALAAPESTILVAGDGTTSTGHKRALLIGCGYANDRACGNPIPSALKDIDRFREALEGQGDFEVWTLTDNGFETTGAPVPGAPTAPTHDGVVDLVERFTEPRKGAGPSEEMLVIFLSGHGFKWPPTAAAVSGDDAEQKDYFSPIGAGPDLDKCVDLDWVVRRLARANVQVGLLVVNACRVPSGSSSGAADANNRAAQAPGGPSDGESSGFVVAGPSRLPEPVGLTGGALDRVRSCSGIWYLQSCSSDEYTFLDQVGGGYYARYLCEALTSTSADLDRDGLVTVEEAQGHAADKLRAHWTEFEATAMKLPGYRPGQGHQTPRMSTGQTSGDLVLATVGPSHARSERRAQTAQADGKTDDAVAAYREALGIEPGCFTCLSGLGKLLDGQGKLAEAEAAYRAAMKAKPDDLDARASVGDVCEREKRWDAALEVYEGGLGVGVPKADRARWLFKAGYCATFAEQYDKGIRYYQQSYGAGYSDVPSVLNNLGYAYIQHQDYATARSTLELGIEQLTGSGPEPDPTVLGRLRCNLSGALRKMGELDLARAEAEEAARLDAQWTRELENVAAAYCAQKQWEPALACLQQVEALGRMTGAGHNLMGKVYADGHHDYSRAATAFAEACRADRQEPMYPYNLGLCLEHLGKMLEAEAEYREALRLKPDYKNAQTALDRLKQGGGGQ